MGLGVDRLESIVTEGETILTYYYITGTVANRYSVHIPGGSAGFKYNNSPFGACWGAQPPPSLRPRILGATQINVLPLWCKIQAWYKGTFSTPSFLCANLSELKKKDFSDFFLRFHSKSFKVIMWLREVTCTTGYCIKIDQAIQLLKLLSPCFLALHF